MLTQFLHSGQGFCHFTRAASSAGIWDQEFREAAKIAQEIISSSCSTSSFLTLQTVFCTSATNNRRYDPISFAKTTWILVCPPVHNNSNLHVTRCWHLYQLIDRFQLRPLCVTTYMRLHAKLLARIHCDAGTAAIRATQRASLFVWHAGSSSSD
jgi:hypothetical protein